jgi:hypothetical protein
MPRDAYSRFMSFKKAMQGQGIKVGRVKPKAADQPPAPAPRPPVPAPQPAPMPAPIVQPIVKPQDSGVKVGRVLQESPPIENPLLDVISFDWEPDLNELTA